MKRILKLWDKLHGSFWFIPTCLVVVSIFFGVAIVEIDYRFETNLKENYPRFFATGAEGAQGILQAIATSMITVAGVTFSVTILILNEASNQYSPRILRNFVRDRSNQFVLGAFLAIFVYCLVVLRTIHDTDDGQFVPALAVMGGVGLAMVGIGVLIFFIHHIAYSIQASSVLQRAGEETLQEVERLYPEEIGVGMDGEPDELPEGLRDEDCWHAVNATKSGYLEFTAPDAVLRFAEKNDTVVRIEYGVGAFVVEGIPLAYVFGEEPPPDEEVQKLRASLSISAHRTVEQDAAFGIRQLVDIALKALSPSTNDTTTAMMCLDYLTPVLARLVQRKMGSPHRLKDRRLRVIVRRPTFEDLLGDCLEQIRQQSAGNVWVLHKLVRMIKTVAPLTSNPARLRAMRQQLEMVKEAAASSVQSATDRKLLFVSCAQAAEEIGR